MIKVGNLGYPKLANIVRRVSAKLSQFTKKETGAVTGSFYGRSAIEREVSRLRKYVELNPNDLIARSNLKGFQETLAYLTM